MQPVLLKFSGWFNIVLAAPLIIPKSAEAYLRGIGTLNELLGLPGIPFTSVAHPSHALGLSTAGIDLVLLGALVLWAARDVPRRRGLLLLNAVGRVVWATVVGYLIVVHDLWAVVAVLAGIDVVLSIGLIRLALSVRETE